MFFARALNELGYDAAVVYEQQMMSEVGHKFEPESKPFSTHPLVEGKFCDHKNGDQILLISNEFILQLLPKYFASLGQDEERKLKIFGASDEKLKNAVYITQHFSYWLYSRKFTNSRLALYTDED